ncbi:uncharacterized protein LOC124938658 [Impatiens glandulifera]|uniref:uncharacterized protein LOC124938658 n=1 Tax=Impatiens glandulifera TaxID=253017 RepID=UPI001FB1111B|nr:uncharacterized protein LOC124938658 [Impatiens glandulifera]
MKMGFSGDISDPHYYTHRVFILCNYILLGAASSCIFLTLSLRLIPSIWGFLLIFLHIITIAGSISGTVAASSSTSSSSRLRWYGAHMVVTVLTTIFQGSVAILIFTMTPEFLGSLKSYVREEDGAVILKMAGGLCLLMFCLNWVVLTLAFFLNYFAYVDGIGRNSINEVRLGSGSKSKIGSCNEVDEETTIKENLPFPFQV